MVGFIISCVLYAGIGIAAVKLGGYVSTKINSNERIKKYVNPKVVTAVAAPALCFLMIACLLTAVSPPQSSLDASNVDWATRDAGFLGSMSDAVLMRVPGATVTPGYLYSTAVLSGQSYVSLMGSPWLATDVPGVVATIAWVVLVAFSAALAFAMKKAVAAGEAYMAKARTPAAALTL
jgi:hypothetical protein